MEDDKTPIIADVNMKPSEFIPPYMHQIRELKNAKQVIGKLMNL